MTAYMPIDDETLAYMAKNMKEYAAEHTFDFSKVIESVQADKSLKKDVVGPMLRVQTKFVRQYTHFIGYREMPCIQLTYYEMEINGDRLGQVTVVNDLGTALDPESTVELVFAFFDETKEFNLMETPPKVCVALQMVK